MEDFVNRVADGTNLDFEYIAQFCGVDGEDIIDYISMPSNNSENEK